MTLPAAVAAHVWGESRDRGREENPMTVQLHLEDAQYVNVETFQYPTLDLVIRSYSSGPTVLVWDVNRSNHLYDRDLDHDEAEAVIAELRAVVDEFNSDPVAGWTKVINAAIDRNIAKARQTIRTQEQQIASLIEKKVRISERAAA